jgi:hypothetical protein
MTMDRRYQVFISSTYRDLKDERRKVTLSVMELDCIPAGMELFPAADEEQFEFIKKVIDDCDYYLVIVGGRYGSVDSTGVSYTEKEYDYAVSRGIKVIALIHDDPDAIPFGKSESDPAVREKLDVFKKKLATGRLVKYWKHPNELSSAVLSSLSKTIKLYPAVGWIRGNRAASEPLLNEINELRKLTADLQKQLQEATPAPPPIDDLAGMDDRFEIKGTYFERFDRSKSSWSTTVTWRQIFEYLGPYLRQIPTSETVKNVLTLAVTKNHATYASGNSPEMDDQLFQTISVQLQALGLVKTQYAESTSGGWYMYWSLTPAGERLMVQLRTVRKATSPEATGPVPHAPAPRPKDLLKKRS